MQTLKVKPQKETPEFFISPLKYYMLNMCSQCDFSKGKCRLDDQNGMKRMELCIRLFCNSPPDAAKILAEAQAALHITEKTGLETLENAEEETPLA